MKSLLVTAALVASLPAFAQTVRTEGECGGPVRIASSGLTPGGDYVVLRGDGVGDAVVPGGPCAGVASGLSSAGFTFYGPFSADSIGSGDLSPTVPVGVAGAYLQALDLTSCRMSSAAEICAGGPSPTEPTAYRPAMVVVPAGSYDQGCTAGHAGVCFANEYPAAVIRLTRSYWMSETEVTTDQFWSLMGYNTGTGWGRYWGTSNPVESLTWHEAAAFTNALSELEGLPGCYVCSGSRDRVTCEAPALESIYECSGYRLPTEAEWEHAARCGTDLRYAGSRDIWSVGWFYRNSYTRTHEVGSKPPNGCGLYDMSGNVWEWTSDWYDWDYYVERPSTDPEGPASGSFKALRGGSWNDDENAARVAFRSYDVPAESDFSLGFRLSRTIP